MTAEQGLVASCEVGVVRKRALRSKDKTLQLRLSAPRLVPSVSEAIWLSYTNSRPRSHRQTQRIPVQPVKSRTNNSADSKLNQLAVGLSCCGLLWLLTHAKLTDPPSTGTVLRYCDHLEATKQLSHPGIGWWVFKIP